MTAEQVARHIDTRARRTGRGKWLARCPVHNDSKPSLGVSDGKRGVVVRCWSHGCTVKDIVAMAGLTMSNLFYDDGTKVDRKQMEAMRLRDAIADSYAAAARWNRQRDLANEAVLRGLTPAQIDLDFSFALTRMTRDNGRTHRSNA